MKCDPGFVRRLRLDGRLPGLRQVGITWTYSRKAVEKFLANWDRRPGSYERKQARKKTAPRKHAAPATRRTIKGLKKLVRKHNRVA
jgi:hypothetical protein